MIVPEMLITEVKPPIAPAAALAMPKVCRVWFGSRCRPSASSRLAASVSRTTARKTTSMVRVGDAVAMARQSTWWSCVQTSPAPASAAAATGRIVQLSIAGEPAATSQNRAAPTRTMPGMLSTEGRR